MRAREDCRFLSSPVGCLTRRHALGGRVGARRPVAGGKTDRGRMAWAAGPWGALSPPPGHRPPPRASRPLRLRPLRRDEVRKGCQRKTCLSRILFSYEIDRGCRGRLLFPCRHPGRPSGRSGIAKTWENDPGSPLRSGRDDGVGMRGGDPGSSLRSGRDDDLGRPPEPFGFPGMMIATAEDIPNTIGVNVGLRAISENKQKMPGVSLELSSLQVPEDIRAAPPAGCHISLEKSLP